jgi:hypothetical protein
MGKCLEKRELSREERYIQTQNNTRKFASKNGKMTEETRVK